MKGELNFRTPIQSVNLFLNHPQYQAQQEETRRLHKLLEQVIQTFDDNPKVIYFKEHLKKRLA